MALPGRSRSGFCVVACVCILTMLSHNLVFIGHHAASVAARRASKTTRLQQSSETTSVVGGLEELIEQVRSRIKDAEKYVPGEKAVLKSISDDLCNKKLRVMFIGEFSAGKSTLINALIGSKACKTGFDPTTMRVSEIAGPEGILYVDSMGINAPDYSEHEAQTIEEMREADVVFLVLRANQLFTRDEVKLCDVLCQNKPKVATVVNYWDIIQDEQDQNVCRKRVASMLEEYLPYACGNRVFFVSASAATKQDEDYAGREDFESLQSFIEDKLGDQTYQKTQKSVTALSKIAGMLDHSGVALAERVATVQAQKKHLAAKEERRSDQARREFEDFVKLTMDKIEIYRESERIHNEQTSTIYEQQYAAKIRELRAAIDNERSGGGDAMKGAAAGAATGSLLGPWGTAAGAALGLFSGGGAEEDRKKRIRRLESALKKAEEAREQYEAEISEALKSMESKREWLETDIATRQKNHYDAEAACRNRFDAEQSALAKEIGELQAKIAALSPFKNTLDALRRDCQQYSDRISETD